jgi:hypothetical protein
MAKVYKLTNKDLKRYIKEALEAALEEITSMDEAGEPWAAGSEPPLRDNEKQELAAMKAKGGSAMSPEEKKKYLSLLRREVATKKAAAKASNDSAMNKAATALSK